MNPLPALQQHQQLCDEIYQCVLDENRFLRQHQRVPDTALLNRKRALLEQRKNQERVELISALATWRPAALVAQAELVGRQSGTSFPLLSNATQTFTLIIIVINHHH